MLLFSNCLKKNISKILFILYFFVHLPTRTISVPSGQMRYTDLLFASQRRSPQRVGKEMPMRGVLIVGTIYMMKAFT